METVLSLAGLGGTLLLAAVLGNNKIHGRHFDAVDQYGPL